MDKVERARDILSFTMASRGAKRQNYEAVKSPTASHLVKISADCAIAAIEATLEPLAERGRAADPDTIAFVQEWMMSSDHDPDQWHRAFAAAIDARSALSRISELESALREAADTFQDAIEKGYPWPREKVEQCAHDKFKWEDCIACYDEFLISKVEEVRAQARNVPGGGRR